MLSENPAERLSPVGRWNHAGSATTTQRGHSAQTKQREAAGGGNVDAVDALMAEAINGGESNPAGVGEGGAATLTAGAEIGRAHV